MKGASTVETNNFEAIGPCSSVLSPVHGTPETIGVGGYGQPESTGVSNAGGYGQPERTRTVEEIEESKRGWFAYFKTKDFYIVLVLGYVILSAESGCFLTASAEMRKAHQGI